MIKQIYRFLSILLISNLLFSQAVSSKTQKNTDKTKTSTCTCQVKHKKSFVQRFFGCKKTEEIKTDNTQTTNDQKPVIQKPDYNDQQYVTKYGVYFNDDIYNTYPQVKPDTKKN
ncbi:MAG: hypothetical protein PHC34_11875 [Candidatus Gastranaerophilales bacterium]|nr:hypothetical protein [Candidatus Gastranaerophilales bacterium]